ncbi:hypothetical protein TURU_036518 [Turdus rufiventris]|nr:hypothetical protein TURU_036518 [Turdus rufiventris]
MPWVQGMMPVLPRRKVSEYQEDLGDSKSSAVSLFSAQISQVRSLGYYLLNNDKWQKKDHSSLTEERSIISHIALQDMKQFYSGSGGNGKCLERDTMYNPTTYLHILDIWVREEVITIDL